MSQELVDSLVTDLRVALARDRDGRDAPSSLTLREALQNGTALKAPDGRDLDLEDIVRAEPTSLAFEADVVTDPVGSPNDGLPECVAYAVVTPASGTWAVQRTVAAWQNGCPASATNAQADALSRDLIVGPVSTQGTGLAAPNATHPLFEYGFYHRQPSGDCVVNRGSNPNAAARNGINEVTVVFFGVRDRRGFSVSEHEAQMSVALPARQSDDYRTALGCA
jgi:hypothetical protein